MKRSQFYTLTALSVILLFAAGCRSNRVPDDRRVVVVERGHMPPGQAKKVYGSRSARPYAHGQRKKYYSYPLIVVRVPGIIITRSSNGRYFYRNNDGFIYWRGYDDRYYLDDSYLGRVQYDNRQYKEWKRKGRR